MNFASRILLILMIWIPCLSKAQKEGNNWYFGTNAGITFNSGSPIALTNGKIATNDGCASISNGYGRLLFYTDGVTVWDSTHTITPNGTGLLGQRSSTQSGVIVPRPDSVGQYFIFTVDYEANSNGLRYSEFKMSLNGGRGDVVANRKNIKLASSTCEKISSVKHINERYFWVLTHKFNSDSIYAFLVKPNGIVSSPVVSATGLVVSGAKSNTNGYMKVSPNGTKIAYANSTHGSAAVANFNTSTGKVSNVWTFSVSDSYGVEFSPSGAYLYITSEKAKEIYQFHVNAGTQSAFLASKVLVDNDVSASAVGALQLGPDGKIYIARVGKAFLSVINSPDVAGVACNVQNNVVSLSGKLCFWGLPTFIQSFFVENKAFYTNNCLNDSTFFYPLITAGIDSMKWDFGDVASGSGNYSKAQNNVFHIYKKTGTYKVRLITFFKTNNDTILIDIPINNPKPYIGTDTAYCGSFSHVLAPEKNYSSYIWSTNEKSKTIVVNKPGRYSLIVMDSLGCRGADTMNVSGKGNVVKPSFSSSYTAICETGNVFLLTNTSTFNSDSLKSVVWKISDNTSFNTHEITKIFKTSGNYNVNLVVTSKKGCMDSITKTLIVFPKPEAGFTINDNPQAFDNHTFSFTNVSKIKSGSIVSNIWYLGDSLPLKAQHIPSKKYLIDTFYMVSLVTVSDKNCKDSIAQKVFFYVELVFNVPNAFTPNGDGNNDTYKPVFIGDIRSYHLEIFNRWGEKLFETDATNNVGWDGTYLGKPCPAGMYNGHIEVVSFKGELKRHDTGVMLMR